MRKITKSNKAILTHLKKGRLFSQELVSQAYAEEISKNLINFKEGDNIQSSIADQFYKVYLYDKRVKLALEELKLQNENAFWHSNSSVKLILDNFVECQAKNGFSPEVLVETFKQIQIILDIRCQNVSNYEISGTYLYNNPSFETLIESFKFALLPTTHITGGQIQQILSSLKSIRYKDIQLARLVMGKIAIFGDLNSKNIDLQISALPLAGRLNIKPGYQPVSNEQTYSKIEDYLNAIQAMEEDKEGYKAGENEEDIEFEGNDFEKLDAELCLLEKIVTQNGKKISSWGSSLLKLRKDYRNLSKVKQNEFIKKNKSIWADLLDIEELLIETGVLDVQDLYLQKDDNDSKIHEVEQKKIYNMARQFVLENKLPIDTFPASKHNPQSSIFEKSDKIKSSQHQEKKTLFNSKAQTNISKVTKKEENRVDLNEDFLSALEGLTEYALLKTEDVVADETYRIKGLGVLVNEYYTHLKHIRKNGDLPMAQEEDIYSGLDVDNRLDTTANIHFHKLFLETSDFVGKVLKNYNKSHSEFDGEQKIEFYLRLENIFKNCIGNIGSINKNDQSTDFINYLRKKFTNSHTNIEKIGILYQIALLSQQSPTHFAPLLEEIFEDFFNSETHILAVNSIHNLKSKTVPEYVENLIYVIMAYENTGKSAPSSANKFIKDLLTLEKVKGGLSVPSDQFEHLAIQFLDTFKDFESPYLRRTVEIGIDRLLPSYLRPRYYIKNKYGESIAVRVSSPKEYGFNQIPKNIIFDQNFPKNMIIGQYISKIVGHNVNVVSIPYEFLYSSGENPFYFGNIEKLNMIENPEIEFSKLLEYLRTSKLNINENSDFSLQHQYIARFEKLATSISESDNSQFAIFSELSSKIIQIYYSSLNEKNSFKMNILVNHIEHLKEQFEQIGFILQRKVVDILQIPRVEDFRTEMTRLINDVKQDTLQTTGKLSFKGKRYGLECISKQNIDSLPDIEWMSYEFLKYPNFVSYRDWKETLFGQNIDFLYSNMKTISNRYGRIESIYLTNGQNFNNTFIPEDFSMNWEYLSFENHGANQDKALDEEYYMQVREQTAEKALMYNLELFKLSLKTGNSYEDKIHKLSKLGVFDSLISQKLSNSKSNRNTTLNDNLKLLQRSPEAFLEYTNEKNNYHILGNEYVRQIKREIQILENVQKLKKQIEINIPQIYEKLKKERKPLEEFYKLKINVEKKYKNALEEVNDQKILYKSDGNFFGIREKITKLEYDLDSLIKFESKVKLEKDLVDNSGKYIINTRKASETNIIKFLIIYSLLTNKSLSVKQNEYLKKWVESIKSNKNTIEDDISDLKFKDLSPTDKRILKNNFNFSYSQDFESFNLNELIFEINQCINHKLIHSFESTIKNILNGQNQNFSFDEEFNNMKRHILDDYELKLWEKNSSLSSDEIKELKSIKKQKYANILNEGTIQIFSNIVDIDFDVVKKITEKVMDVSYSNISKEQIETFVNNFTKRGYLLNHHLPEKFCLTLIGILEHSNSSIVDKEVTPLIIIFQRILQCLKCFNIQNSILKKYLQKIEDNQVQHTKSLEEFADEIESLYEQANYQIQEIMWKPVFSVVSNLKQQFQKFNLRIL